MEENRNAFLLNNQSAAAAMSALQAASNMMEKSSSSIHSNHLPFYPYVTPETLHSDQHQTPQVSSNSPQHQMVTNVATPFGINDILSQKAASEVSGRKFHGNSATINDFNFNKTPASATMATMGGKRAAASVAAQAAAMLFNNHQGHHFGAQGNGGMGQGVHGNSMKIGKSLTDLPRRPPNYWPGMLTEDWHKKLGMHGW